MGCEFENIRLIVLASADKTARLEANARASLTLYCDAKAKNDRFAICDKRGNPVWHGRFFATDHDYNGEQSSGEIAVAKKAVWLACKVKATLGLSAIKLALKADAEWLCYANAVRAGNPGGGRARARGPRHQIRRRPHRRTYRRRQKSGR